MNKIIPIILLIICFSCGHQDKNNYIDQTSKIYTSNQDFGEIDNSILESELDSIINILPYWILANYKTTEFREGQIVEFLKMELRLKGLNPNEFLIIDITKNNDSLSVFHLDHIDSYIYKHNRDKMIKKIPPITGNVSGHEGWYIVDFNKKKLEIKYAQ